MRDSPDFFNRYRRCSCKDLSLKLTIDPLGGFRYNKYKPPITRNLEPGDQGWERGFYIV
jgi:hypothetical protein